MYQSILKKLNFFKKIKLKFYPLKKCELLLVDNNYSNLKFKNFRTAIWNTNEFYFFSFLKVLILYYLNNKEKLNLISLYKQNIYRSYGAKIAIDHNLTGRAQELKKLCPEIKTIVYQIGFFEPHNKIILPIRKLLSSSYKACEFFLCLAKSELLVIKKIGLDISKKIIIAGSVQSNERPIVHKKKIYDILYISQYVNSDDNFPWVHKGKHFSHSEIGLINHNKDEAFIIKTIDEYCNRYNKKSTIALRSLRKERKRYGIKAEVDHVEKALNKKFNVIRKRSWDLAAESKLIVANCSNLAFELRSRGSNVLFLPLESTISKKYGVDKRTNLMPQKNEINICREHNKKLIFKKINFLLSIDKKLKKSPHFKKQINIIKYDNKNSILKGLIKILLLTKT